MITRLVYVYISDYGNIKGQGFDLSSDYEISIENEIQSNNEKSKKLKISIKNIENGLPHLFNNNIIDIKGVVGENGAGKSTLLRFLAFECHNNFVSLSDYWPNYNFLIYETLNQEKERILKICFGFSWEKVNIEIEKDPTILLEIIDEQPAHLSWQELIDFSETSFIYYSNIFDNKTETGVNGLINVSTNYLVSQDPVKWSNAQINISDFEGYRLSECSRQVNFALHFKGHLPFALPTSLNLSFNNNSDKLIQSTVNGLFISKESDKELLFLLNKWLEIRKNILTKFGNIDNLLYLRILNTRYINYFIYHHLVNYDSKLNEIYNYKSFVSLIFKKLLIIYEESKGIVDWDLLVDFIDKNENEMPFKSNGINVSIKGISFTKNLIAFNEFAKEVKQNIINKPLFLVDNFEIKLNEKTNDLISFYRQSLHITPYIDFSFPGLSSGEIGFLTFFSRFFYLVDELSVTGIKIPENNKSIVIFIDEGDLYFHPKWQTKYLAFINRILPEILTGKKIQIFLTSHSPFLASDLPTNHLLFLHKRKLSKNKIETIGTCEVLPSPVYTFAANIHELLAHSFFLEGAHIGELAKEILFKIIDQLDGIIVEEPLSKLEIKAIIDQVGEPWVKSRLLEKFENYFLEESIF